MSEWTSMQLDLPNEAERRRYALLQAAVQLAAAWEVKDITWSYNAAVEHAENILAEIEKREKVAQ